MLNLEGKIVTIIGAKRSGLALARLVLRLNGQLRISDSQAVEQMSKDDLDWINQRGIRLENNIHTREFISGSDFLVLSPGVRFDSIPVQWAKEMSIPVFGEIEFAYQFCQSPIIAVTGSNGKTTVVTLINKVLTQAGYKSRLCGNVGFPFSDYCIDGNEYDFFVLELSSFQLESLIDKDNSLRKDGRVKGFRPFIAVLLNFSQNHLDRHKDIAEYFEAKQKIFYNQTADDHAVLNHSSALIRDLTKKIDSTIHWFNQAENVAGLNPNFLAVRKVADILGVSEEGFNEVIHNFKGVEHRMELVRTLDGVDFINDSKSTTAEAGNWALSQMQRPVMMICGGKDKNIDFTVLAEIVRKKVKKMFVIGEAKEKIKNSFRGFVQIEECQKLEEAVRSAKNQADHGDCVLLSPMCASFDMFKDYEDRGRIYKSIVNNL
ncbi:MAG: Mur ligase family protein [Candidatus Omnitrophota bacterium]